MLLNTRLKELRKENGITQSELAKSLNVSRSSIAMYENGERIPSYETLEVISDFFNVSILYLLGKDFFWRSQLSFIIFSKVWFKASPSKW